MNKYVVSENTLQELVNNCSEEVRKELVEDVRKNETIIEE